MENNIEKQEFSKQEFNDICNTFAKYIIANAQRDFDDNEKRKLDLLMGILDDAISYDRFVPMPDEQYRKWSKHVTALLEK